MLIQGQQPAQLAKTLHILNVSVSSGINPLFSR